MEQNNGETNLNLQNSAKYWFREIILLGFRMKGSYAFKLFMNYINENVLKEGDPKIEDNDAKFNKLDGEFYIIFKKKYGKKPENKSAIKDEDLPDKDWLRKYFTESVDPAQNTLYDFLFKKYYSNYYGNFFNYINENILSEGLKFESKDFTNEDFEKLFNDVKVKVGNKNFYLTPGDMPDKEWLKNYFVNLYYDKHPEEKKIKDLLKENDIEGLAEYVSSKFSIKLAKEDISIDNLNNELQKEHSNENWLKNYFVNLYYDKHPEEKKIKDLLKENDIEGLAKYVSKKFNIELTKYDINSLNLRDKWEKEHSDENWLKNYFENLYYENYPDAKKIEEMKKDLKLKIDKLKKIKNVGDAIQLGKETANLAYEIYVADAKFLSQKDNVTGKEKGKVLGNLADSYYEISEMLSIRRKANIFERRKIQNLAKQLNKDAENALNYSKEILDKNQLLGRPSDKVSEGNVAAKELLGLEMSKKSQKMWQKQTKKNNDITRKIQKKPDEFQKEFFYLAVNKADNKEFAKLLSKYIFIEFNENRDKEILNKINDELWYKLKEKGAAIEWKAEDMPKLGDIKDRCVNLYFKSDISTDNDLVKIRQMQFDFGGKMEELNKAIKSEEINVTYIIGAVKDIANLAHAIFANKVKVLKRRDNVLPVTRQELLLDLSNVYSKLQKRLEDLGKNPKVNKSEKVKIENLKNQIRAAETKVNEHGGISNFSFENINGHKYKIKHREKVYDENCGNVGKREVSVEEFKVGQKSPLGKRNKASEKNQGRRTSKKRLNHELE